MDCVGRHQCIPDFRSRLLDQGDRVLLQPLVRDMTEPLRYLSEIDPNYTVFFKPLPWQEAGLQQTASGYGKKLTSERMVRLHDGRTRRVYITCFSNAGTAWVSIDGKRWILT